MDEKLKLPEDKGGWTDVIHLTDFARRAGRTPPSLRYLVRGEKCIRPMKHIDIGSRVYVPTTEILGYPFRSAGVGNQRAIYHYAMNADGTLTPNMCKECTFGDGCELRHAADALPYEHLQY